MMRRKIFAVFCLMLFLSLPFVQGAEIVKEEQDEQDTGGSIAVNVRSYEPTILTSNLIEDGNVPVYVFLGGSTPGTLLGSSSNVEPFYGNIDIEKMLVKPLTVETEGLIEGTPKYSKPNKYDVDTLGYLTITLKQFDPDTFEICADDSACDEGYTCETGACIPKEINLSFTAEIWFKNAERLYSLSKSALILPVDADEDTWVEKLDMYGAQYSFYGGRGLVRIKDIRDDSVDLTVYSNKDLYWPIIGAPRAIADVHLQKGETSEYIDLGYTDEQVLGNAKFRITLNSLKDPMQERAVVGVTVNGVRSQLIVTEGMSLYPGSTWTVKEIQISEGRTGKEFVLTVKDAKGNVEKIVTSQAGGLEESESALLNKKFYEKPSTEKDAFLFDTSTKVLSAQSFETLEGTFRELGVMLDVSAVATDAVQTNKITLENGVTLKEVLLILLPNGYYYSVVSPSEIAIKKFSSEDPCLNAEIYTEEGIAEVLKEVDDSEKLDTRLKLDILCTAISHFQQVVQEYPDEKDVLTNISLFEQGYHSLGKSYDALMSNPFADLLTEEQKKGALERALAAYQELVQLEKGVHIQEAQQKIDFLTNLLYGETSLGTASLQDNGQFVFVELLSVQELGLEQRSSTVMTKDGLQKSYFVGDTLFSSTFGSGKDVYTWYVHSISDQSVQVRKVFTSSGKVTSKTLEVDGSAEIIEGYSFKVRSVDTKKEAYLTITPGTGGSLRSKSNFSVHIPIESRAFDLNPAKIDDQIAKAKKLQEKLEDIVTTLDKIVRTWKKVCLGVFAFVTLKSSFGGASAEARHDAIHGVNNEKGWAAYCQEKSAGAYSERAYKTYDECMLANAQQIEVDIDAAARAQKYVNGLNGNYDEDLLRITNGYTNLGECKELVGSGTAFFDEKTQKDYVYLNYLKGQGVSEYMAVDTALESYTGTSDVYLQGKVEGCNTVSEALKKREGDFFELTGEKLTHAKKELAIGVFETVYNEQLRNGDGTSSEIPTTKTFPALTNNVLGEGRIISVGRVFRGKSSKTFTVYSTTAGESLGSKIDIQELTVADYLNILKEKVKEYKGTIEESDGDITGVEETKCNGRENECLEIEKDLVRIAGKKGYSGDQLNRALVADTGARYYMTTEGVIEERIIYVGPAAYATGALSEKYAEGAKIEIYDSGVNKGLPYCLPYKEGNFIKFLEYTTNNEIKTIEYWNVGSDGQLCTGDDILVAHESELYYNTASPSYTQLVNFANAWVKKTYYQNERHEIDTHVFLVSYGKSKAVLDGATASCFDVMDPEDCRLLFNTCDPVMCPPSRFNFGGRWQVDNVVESGIVGSVVLPLGSGDIVPVCLTGVLASLHYWKSMLDGYVECLEAAKYEGKSVGVCDKIRSVYVCELIVREIAAIMDNNKDGLLDFLSNKLYGQKDKGGGEYFKFKENLQNVENSISYFTTEYASTSFAAFKGRSLEEVGTSICRQAIYGQAPLFADFIEQVTTPEDPNQFYATLTVKPYAPSLAKAAYQVYYHIYAGVNPNIQNVVYQVYLRNSLTPEIFYTTDICTGVSSSIELGGMVDRNLDCLAAEGFDTVCVVMNGETHCGFGTVTTAFSYGYVKDVLVADEVKREIDSEEECYPQVSVASPTASSLATFGKTQSLVLPYNFGELSTGIQRVCALQDPGLGQGGKGDWKAVGTCGKDADGRSLGYCWMNVDSVSIKDAERSENIQKHLETENFQILKGDLENLMDEKRSKGEFTNLISLKKQITCSTYLDLGKKFKDLYDLTLDYTYAANAQYQLGEVYFAIATNVEICALKGRTQIDYTAELDGKDLGRLTEIPFDENDKGKLDVTFKNLVKEENPDVVMHSAISDELKVVCTLSEEVWICTVDIDLVSSTDEVTVTFTIDRIDSDEDYVKVFIFSPEFLEKETSSGFVDASEVCESNCGRGTVNFCDEEECHGITNGCYFVDGYLLNKCFACFDLNDDRKSSGERCAALSDDKEGCVSKNCYKEFLNSGECAWLTPEGENEASCVYVAPESTGLLSRGGVSSSADCQATEGDDYERAFLDAIAAVEGPNYNTIVGRGTFDFDQCAQGHPYVWNKKLFTGLPSNAAGRYQFIYSTYGRLKDNGQFVDDNFCQESQDKAALKLISEKEITSKGIQTAYTTKQWTSVFDKVAPVWAAFPYSQSNCERSKYPSCGNGNSYYESSINHAANSQTIITAFEKCLTEYKGGTSSGLSVLLLGDSHSVGTYGQTLYELFSRSGNSVDMYAQCGASPSWFVTGQKGSCGSLFLVNDVENKQQQVTPKIKDLEITPNDIIIFSLGANLRGSGIISLESIQGRKKTIQDDVKKLLDALPSDVRCYWVGPPQGPSYEDENTYDEFNEYIQEAVGEKCIYLDSKSSTTFNFCVDTPFDCDADPHFDHSTNNENNNAGKEVASDWANEVYSEVSSS